MFRYKRSIHVDYEKQGYIYFVSRRYEILSQKDKRRIESLCREAGGEYWKALFEFVTTDTGAAEICRKHYISASTLERAVRRYYVKFAELM